MAAFHVFGRENGQTVHLNTYRERSAAMACCAAKVDASKARRPMVCVWAVSVGASLHDDACRGQRHHQNDKGCYRS